VFTEDAIRKNFVLVYELLDETLDNGYPQCTSTDLLMPFVYNEAIPPTSSLSVPSWAQVSLSTNRINRINRINQSTIESINEQTHSHSKHAWFTHIQGSLTRQSSIAANRPISLAVGQNSAAGGANEVFVDLIESLTVTITSEVRTTHGL